MLTLPPPVFFEREERAQVIPFRVQPQEMFNWCWAAVTASVVAYLSPQNASIYMQCAIASAELDEQCCRTPRPASCDQTNGLDGPLSRVSHLRVPIIEGYLGAAAIATELQADLPLPLRIEWSNGSGHFLCIYGIRNIDGGIQLAVSDPIYEESTIMSDALIGGGYQSAGGRWTHTYVVTRQ